MTDKGESVLGKMKPEAEKEVKAAKLYCYVCGKDITNMFALAFMKDTTDRPFTVHGECVEGLEEVNIIYVEEAQKCRMKRQRG